MTDQCLRCIRLGNSLQLLELFFSHYRKTESPRRHCDLVVLRSADARSPSEFQSANAHTTANNMRM